MGLLGNKDKDTKNPTKTETPPQLAKSPETPPPTPTPAEPSLSATISEWKSSACSTWKEWKSSACGWCESPQMKEIQRLRKEFADNFCHPVGDLYRSLPADITSSKFDFISKYDQNQRLLSLEAITLLSAISSLKTRENLGLSQRFLFSLRNSAAVFAVGGLLLVPEIYNPLIKSDF